MLRHEWAGSIAVIPRPHKKSMWSSVCTVSPLEWGYRWHIYLPPLTPILTPSPKRPATHLQRLWCCGCPWVVLIDCHRLPHIPKKILQRIKRFIARLTLCLYVKCSYKSIEWSAWYVRPKPYFRGEACVQ